MKKTNSKVELSVPYNVLKSPVAKVVLATSLVTSMGAGLPVTGHFPYSIGVESAEAASLFDGGTGTITDPYLISNKIQLNEMRNNLTSHFKLTGNIDLSGVAWIPVGSNTTIFKGSFDGDGFTISGLTVNTTTDMAGLFGYMNGGSIKNIHLTGVNVKGTNRVGGLVGYVQAGTVKNVSVKGTVSGKQFVGGVVGYSNINGKVLEEMASFVDVIGETSVGGIVGSNSYGTIQNSFSTGNVKASGNSVGGILGQGATGTVKVLNVFSTGDIEGAQYVGGLVGNGSFSLSNGLATGTVTGGDYTGGLVGSAPATAHSNLYALNEKVTSTSSHKAGKAFGEASQGSTISSVYLPETSIGVGNQQTVTKLLTNEGVKSPETYRELISTGLWEIDSVSQLPVLSFNRQSLDDIVLNEKVNYVERDGIIYAAITTKEELQQMNDSLNVDYLLMNDIDLTGVEWTPIGDSLTAEQFTGNFDGDGHKITGLRVNTTKDNVGLFGYVKKGTIKNIHLSNVNIQGGNRVGGLMGQSSAAIVKNVSVEGTVTGKQYVGGIIGGSSDKGAHLEEMASFVHVTGESLVGGVVGLISYGVLQNSFSTGNVKATDNSVGGILGQGNSSELSVKNVYSTGDIEGGKLVGGLVGTGAVHLSNGFATGTVIGGDFTGGLVGQSSATTYSNLLALNEAVISTSIDKAGKAFGIVYNNSTISGISAIDTLVGPGHSNNITQTITVEQASQKNTYLGFEFGDLGDTPIWRITENESLPSLVFNPNVPTLDGDFDAITEATLAVEKAEGTKIQVDVDSARDLVDQLSEGQGKTELTNRLDIVQKFIDDLKDSKLAVEKAEESKTQNDLDTARDKVNQLPEGKDKTDLNNRLDEVQQVIDDAKVEAEKLADAIVTVEKAEGTKSQADVDTARDKVNLLPEGKDKTDLNNRLDEVQQAIDDAQAEADKFADAIASVEKAEGSKTQTDLDVARDKVNQLPEGQDKTDLNNRLDEVQQAIDDAKAEAEKLADATDAVTKAEGSQSQADVDVARDKVNQLPEGQDKTDLNNRLDEVQQVIDDAKVEAEKLADAIVTVEKAEGTKSQADVDTARDKVNLLPEGKDKADLNNRLDEVQQAIDDAQAEADKFADAIASVEKAEGSKTQTDLDVARDKVNQLPEGQDKTDLNNRLDEVQQAIDDAKAEAEKLADATDAVTKAEGSQSQADVDVARDKVNQLPKGQDKTDLNNRLDEVQQVIDDAKVEAEKLADAIVTVEKAEGTKSQADVDTARDKVNLLPEGKDKTDLNNRLDEVQQVIDDAKAEAEKLADAIASVEKAEGTKSQEDVDTARDKVNLLPEGKDKTDLNNRLDEVQQAIDDAKAEEEKLADATDAVTKAEGSQSQTDVDAARDKVSQLPNGTDKTELTDRLDAVQQVIDAQNEAQKLAEATQAVVKAEGSQSQADVDMARPLVSQLPNGQDKTDLTNRLDAVQQLIDIAKNEAQKLADATNAVVKAEGSQSQADVDIARPLVNLLPNSQDKTDLSNRLDAVQQAIDDAKAEAEKLTEATDAVTKAEGSQSQADVDLARDKVNQLPNGTDKTELTDRLDAVQQVIDAQNEAQKLAEATQAVVKAEGSQSQADVDMARPLVSQLPNGQDKTDLTNRLDAVQQLIDIAKNEAQKLADATNAVVKAEGSQSQADVDIARPLVNLLPNSQDKTDLSNRLDAVQQAIDDAKAEAEKLTEATDAVTKAEGSQSQVDVDAARDKVNQLPNGTDKTVLTERLDAVQQVIDAQNEAQKLAEATQAVVKAEGSQSQADVDTARPLVSQLPNGQDKKDLTDRLDAVQQIIDNNQGQADLLAKATQAVLKAEGSRTQADVDSARALVNELSDGQDKIDLTNRLDAIQIDNGQAEADLLAKATQAVLKAEGSRTQADVDSARALVDQLSDGQDKIDLTNRLDAIQIDNGQAEADLLAKATQAVLKAEGSRTQADVDSARALVNQLSDGQDKIDLTNRLDAIQIDNGQAEADLLVKATQAVVKAEGSRTQSDVDAARALVNQLSDGQDKIDLTNRLDAIQIDNGQAEADLLVKATQAVVKA
ncbi:ZmpA/ZmpB/ZmpC family metallo-endopeptidase-related protein, partial [Psychrobacillus sp. FSL K6-1267]